MAEDPRSRRTPSGIRAALRWRSRWRCLNPGAGPELSQPQRTRLDLLKVAVVAEYLDGTANRRVDGALGSLRHRIGDVQRFEEQRRNRRRSARVGVEVDSSSQGGSDCRPGRLPPPPGRRILSASSTSAPTGTTTGPSCPRRGRIVRWWTAFWRTHGRAHRLVPPEVTTGRVVVVVGGNVVVVVGGNVVVVGATETGAEPWSAEVGVVVGGDVTVVEVLETEVVVADVVGD